MMKTANIIGLGASAQHWPGEGFSIGVNDAGKFGHPINWLVVVNHPSKFSKEPDRMATIVNTKPERFFSHTYQWRQYFPSMEHLRLTNLSGKVRKGIYYKSNTSPFVAMSLAFNLVDGLEELVLWGVDFTDHKTYHPGTRHFTREIYEYKLLCQALNKVGVQVYLGAPGSALESFLKVKP